MKHAAQPSLCGRTPHVPTSSLPWHVTPPALCPRCSGDSVHVISVPFTKASFGGTQEPLCAQEGTEAQSS